MEGSGGACPKGRARSSCPPERRSPLASARCLVERQRAVLCWQLGRAGCRQELGSAAGLIFPPLFPPPRRNGLDVQVTPPSCCQLLGTTRYGEKRPSSYSHGGSRRFNPFNAHKISRFSGGCGF